MNQEFDHPEIISYTSPVRSSISVDNLQTLHSQPWLKYTSLRFYLIDINVLTLFSRSAFLADGVLLSLRSSSITTFSTVSMLFKSFFWGVKQWESPSFWLVILRSIFGTLPIVGGQRLNPILGCGDIVEESCSSWATDVDVDVDAEESWTIRSGSIGLSVCRPSPSPRRLLRSIA